METLNASHRWIGQWFQPCKLLTVWAQDLGSAAALPYTLLQVTWFSRVMTIFHVFSPGFQVEVASFPRFTKKHVFFYFLQSWVTRISRINAEEAIEIATLLKPDKVNLELQTWAQRFATACRLPVGETAGWQPALRSRERPQVVGFPLNREVALNLEAGFELDLWPKLAESVRPIKYG